jgi:subtilisin family serine protease
VEEESQNLLEPYLTLREELDHVGSAGHGTRVGSLVGGRFVGAAGGLRLIVYRVTDSPIMTSASASTVAAGIKHAVLDNGCEIVLLTCGDPKENVAEIASQVDLAYNNGVVVIAAAGELASTVAFPARYSRPITVSGTTNLDKPWTAAARGIAVDICAPACDITLADTALCAGVLNPIYRTDGDGTAYAAAQVAGAAALWLAYRRQDLVAHARSWHLVEALRQCIASSATRPVGWTDRLWGAGILNVPRLLRTPVPDTSQLTQRPACSEQQL